MISIQITCELKFVTLLKTTQHFQFPCRLLVITLLWMNSEPDLTITLEFHWIYHISGMSFIYSLFCN